MGLKRMGVFLAINLAVFIAILFWLWENISLARLLDHFRSLPTTALLGSLALNAIVLGVYGFRLSLLLPARKPYALSIVIIGFGLNNILPFRLGEVAKLAYARQCYGIATSRVIAATATEKLMDLCALLLLGLAASQLVVAPYLDRSLIIAGMLVCILVAVFTIAYLGLALSERLGRKVHDWITEAFNTLRLQRSRPRIIQLTLLTAVVWAITVASVLWMFGSIFPQFSLADACVLTLVLALAIALPSAPAGFGVVETAIIAYLHQTAHTEPNQALASAMAFHLTVVAPQVLAVIVVVPVELYRSKGFRNG